MALLAGYGHIDCARVYDDEEEVRDQCSSFIFPPLHCYKKLMHGRKLFSNGNVHYLHLLGLNQVGVALKELFNSGVVKRSEMWITSKLWYANFYCFTNSNLVDVYLVEQIILLPQV